MRILSIKEIVDILNKLSHKIRCLCQSLTKGHIMLEDLTLPNQSISEMDASGITNSSFFPFIKPAVGKGGYENFKISKANLASALGGGGSISTNISNATTNVAAAGEFAAKQYVDSKKAPSRTITSGTTLLTTDGLVLVNAASNNIENELPNAAAYYAVKGSEDFVVMRIDDQQTNWAVTWNSLANGVAIPPLVARYSFQRFKSDGVDWKIAGNKTTLQQLVNENPVVAVNDGDAIIAFYNSTGSQIGSLQNSGDTNAFLNLQSTTTGSAAIYGTNGINLVTPAGNTSILFPVYGNLGSPVMLIGNKVAGSDGDYYQTGDGYIKILSTLP